MKIFDRIRIIVIFFLALLVYLPLLKGDFIQEEWYTLLTFYDWSSHPLSFAIAQILTPPPGQYNPVYIFVLFLIFFIFKTNYLAFLIVGLLLHGVVGLLLSNLLHKLTGNYWLSILGGVLFVIAPQHFQATSWVIANIGYSLSAIFMLICLNFYLKWIEKNNFFLGILTSFFLVLSLLCKEISSFLILALPIISYFWKKNINQLIKTVIIVMPAFLFEIWHYYQLHIQPHPQLPTNNLPGLINLITLPLRLLVEALIPQEYIYLTAKMLLFLIPPIDFQKLSTTKFNLAVESWGAAIVVLLVSVLIGILTYRIYKKNFLKNPKLINFFLMGIFLSVFSSYSYFFVDSKRFALLQPRYVYIGVIFLSFSISIWLSMIKKPRKYFLFIFIIVGLLAFKTFWMSYQLGLLGFERRSITSYINEKIPDYTKQLIIYVESDRSFYGMPDDVKTLPFQIGPGKVLSVILYDKIYHPEITYKYETFIEIESEGYFFDEVGGYGYFRNFDNLKKTVLKYHVSLNNVYAFKYRADNKSIIDITPQIQDVLKN